MRHLYLLAALLTLALVAPARRPGRHAPGAVRPPLPPLPRRPRAAHRVRPYLSAEPPPPPPDVEPEAALVRPYVLAEERRREQESADATRLRLAALMDLAQAEPVPKPAPAPAGDLGELADAVRAYLATTQSPQSPATRHRSKSGRHLVAVNPTSHPCPPTGTSAERRPRTEGAR